MLKYLPLLLHRKHLFCPREGSRTEEPWIKGSVGKRKHSLSGFAVGTWRQCEGAGDNGKHDKSRESGTGSTVLGHATSPLIQPEKKPCRAEEEAGRCLIPSRTSGQWKTERTKGMDSRKQAKSTMKIAKCL